MCFRIRKCSKPFQPVSAWVTDLLACTAGDTAWSSRRWTIRPDCSSDISVMGYKRKGGKEGKAIPCKARMIILATTNMLETVHL